VPPSWPSSTRVLLGEGQGQRVGVLDPLALVLSCCAVGAGAFQARRSGWGV